MQDPESPEILAIIQKAKALSEKIRAHPVSRRYAECLTLMENDPEAREVHSRLVALGEELNAGMADGSGGASSPAEFELIREKLDNTPLVKEFILSRREYLEMMGRVLERIREST
ncbi:MAG: YlbF family regulator [Spirochaetes bacterium]|nr:YlbF family regulator [Spirochaetota bacterium]